MNQVLRQLGGKIRHFDGAMGTMLQKSGVELGRYPETLAITNPQTGLLVGIVISFICEWLLTKDFGGKKVSEAAETVEAVQKEA